MNDFTVTNLIVMLDREFEKTIEKITRNDQKLEQTGDYREIAKIASENAELSDYANTLFELAQQVLGV
jgi:hypothetical protein